MVPFWVSLIFAPPENHPRGLQALFLRKEGGRGHKEASEKDQVGPGKVATPSGPKEGLLRRFGPYYQPRGRARRIWKEDSYGKEDWHTQK